uniref:NADH-ubiquinone oxidoreductase chain 4L n=1 Tax=Phyllidiella hageni TaxID=2873953 RepID=A0AA96LU41_9GAST|nr:NADH dehydrogenase subunit 4L [Phyllidiella hageni]WNR50672.1 NADH dehydrogenase subunit 4L [Phyllidiella hageni]WNR50685.1 NADH dehydrogenase subunit 4L [Phyllidiella hageni]WNR50698.1 NADH dehydrogenase subunit 4L [Phyllidiella hageni]
MKISWIGMVTSFFSFTKLNDHILILLISLEALMLSLLVFIFSTCLIFNMSYSMFLVLLTFAACEAALGLSLLVSILRLRSNDFVMSFNSMKFYA